MADYIIVSDLEQIYALSKGTGNQVAQEKDTKFVIMLDESTQKKYSCLLSDFETACTKYGV